MNSKRKKIGVIGIGKLGLCFALSLEKNGYDVLGVDVNINYVESLNKKSLKSFEANVENYLQNSKFFQATTSLKQCIEHSDELFVFVATPSLNNGSYDHSQIDSVVNKLIKLGVQSNPKHLIIGCTTMPGYCDTAHEKLHSYGYLVSYNPEFIAQGTILNDLVNPDIILIGTESKATGKIIAEIYLTILQNKPTIHRMSRKEAEITKIALNCFLTTKIAFANMVGDIAQLSNCDPSIILNAIGTDSRVGNKYLKYGFGFGGPCLPRDNKALAKYGSEIGLNALISIASDNSNFQHLEHQIDYFIQNNSKEKPVYIAGVSYKKNTDIIEESQQFKFALALANVGFKVIIEESEKVINQIDSLYPNLFEFKKISQY